MSKFKKTEIEKIVLFKAVEFKVYMHEACQTGYRIMFKFRSGTHGFNEGLGRHRMEKGVSIVR